MQKLCKNYAKITQKKLRKDYAYVCKLHNLHYYAPPTLLMDGISRDIPLQILRITRDIPVFSRLERGVPGHACLCTLQIAPECSNRAHNHLDQVMQALFFIRGVVWFLYPGALPRPRRVWHRPGQPRDIPVIDSHNWT